MFIEVMMVFWRFLWLHLLQEYPMIMTGWQLMTPRFASTMDGMHILHTTLLHLVWRSIDSSARITSSIHSRILSKHNSFSSRSKAWKWLTPWFSIAICLLIGVSSLSDLVSGVWACNKRLASSFVLMISTLQLKLSKTSHWSLGFVSRYSNYIFFQKRLFLGMLKWWRCKLSSVSKNPRINMVNRPLLWRNARITPRSIVRRKCTEG